MGSQSVATDGQLNQSLINEVDIAEAPVWLAYVTVGR